MENEKLTRRGFLKLLGLGAGGLAFSLSRLSDLLDLSTQSDSGGISMRDRDPENPSEGELWFRRDLASED